MRITFLLPYDNFTGGTRVVVTYARMLQARGHDVMVVCNRQPLPKWREGLRMLRHRRWEMLRQRLWPRPGLVAVSGVPFKVLDRCRPFAADDLPDADAVVATWWETAVAMHQLPLIKGRRVHLIQGYEVWGGGESVRDRVHEALRLPNLKLVISAGLQREIQQAAGPLNMHVIPNGVDLQSFDAPRRERKEPPAVGFVYAHAHIKGVDRVLRAISKARESVPELQVHAFGAQPPVDSLPLPTDSRYAFRPPQADIAGLYAACDAWLFPSRQDSFGLPLLEAMACRTPVIGVPVGAAPDLLTAGCGVLLQDADCEDALCDEMARAIVRLCQMPAAEWLALSDAAYARAQQCGWEQSVEALERLLLSTQVVGYAP